MQDACADAELVEAVARQILASLSGATRVDHPYVTWRLRGVLPEPVARRIAALPFSPGELGGVSGARELHNDTRHFLAGEVLRCEPAMAAAAAFQSAQVASALAQCTGARLEGTFLRIEYAADVDGFWLRPHTDLGVKRLTLLIPLGAEGQAELGTDLYESPQAWCERIPFLWNTGLMFVPSDITWHGFEPRPFQGVRRSLIVNYVSDEWRARHELAFPAEPVSLG